MYTLVLISVIRYATVVHAASTARYRTTGRVVAMIVTIWLLVLAFNTPVLTRYGVKDTSAGCVISSELAARQLYATFFTFAYVVPLTVIAVCSVGILRHIRRHRLSSGNSLECHVLRRDSRHTKVFVHDGFEQVMRDCS